MNLAATPIPPRSHLVRVLTADCGAYDRLILVTEQENRMITRRVVPAGWIGEPLTPAEWHDAKAKLLPDAEEIRFHR